MLASQRPHPFKDRAVKKGIVVILVILAVTVLLTPGLIGRIAEQSVDENLQRAAEENEDTRKSFRSAKRECAC